MRVVEHVTCIGEKRNAYRGVMEKAEGETTKKTYTQMGVDLREL
jgi:hypothetical protein